jgi:hypothetical protein
VISRIWARHASRRGLTVGAALLAMLTTPAEAQRGRGRGFRAPDAGVGNSDFSAFNVPYDGRFTFVRLRFTPDYTGWGRGGGFFAGVNYWWDHDYPTAERHFSTMVAELTAVSVTVDASNILAVTDPGLSQYPVAYVSEPGHWTQTDEEAAAFRAYLLKGGFAIFDDFTGQDWFNFELQMGRVLPELRLVRLDASHPIFHSFFEIESLEPFVHPMGRFPASFYGVFEDNDPTKRLLVIANYDNDIGDAWEWSDTGWVPIDLSNEAYKLGINYIVYAMTH